MKKIFLIVFMTVIFFVLSVSAEEYKITVSYSSLSDSINISGRVSEKENLLAVITIAASDADISTETNNIIFDAEFTDKNGSINVTEKIPESFSGGKYTVYVNADGRELTDYFINVSMNDIKNLLPDINGVHSNLELLDIIERNMTELSIDEAVFNTNKNEISNILYSLMPYGGFSSAEEFVYGYNNASAAAMIENGDKISDILTRYGAEIGIDCNAQYMTLTEEQRNILDGYIKRIDYKSVSLKDGFEKNRTLSILKSAKSRNELSSLFNSEKSNVNVDMTYYNKLKIPDKVFEQMYSELDKIDSLDNFITKFYNISHDLYISENRPVDNGGGSGGGGGTYSDTKIPTALGSEDEAEKNTFSDIKDHWAEKYVKQMSEKNVINGYPDGSFKPENTVTRAEFVKMAVSAFNISGNIQLKFKDTLPQSWYYNVLENAVAAGIINGISDTSFAPDADISRQDVAVILFRIMKKNVSFEDTPNFVFTDFDEISEYARDAVSKLSEQKIISGFDGAFNPLDSTTRAQAAALICRAMEKLGMI